MAVSQSGLLSAQRGTRVAAPHRRTNKDVGCSADTLHGLEKEPTPDLPGSLVIFPVSQRFKPERDGTSAHLRRLTTVPSCFFSYGKIAVFYFAGYHQMCFHHQMCFLTNVFLSNLAFQIFFQSFLSKFSFNHTY